MWLGLIIYVVRLDLRESQYSPNETNFRLRNPFITL